MVIDKDEGLVTNYKSPKTCIPKHELLIHGLKILLDMTTVTVFKKSLISFDASKSRAPNLLTSLKIKPFIHLPQNQTIHLPSKSNHSQQLHLNLTSTIIFNYSRAEWRNIFCEFSMVTAVVLGLFFKTGYFPLRYW